MPLVVRNEQFSGDASSRPTLLLWLSSLVAALGGLLFGLDTAVISGTTAQLTKLFHLSPTALGVTVSSALLGTIAGSLISGRSAERWGRRAGLRISAIAYLVSAIGCGFSGSWAVLIVFRIIGGIGIGGSSVLGPMYIAEIAPAAWRGRLVALFQLNIVLGILLAYLSNYVIGRLQLGAVEWRWELGITALPSALFLLLLLLIPDSPRWLVKRGRSAEALSILQRIGEKHPQNQVEQMESALQSAQQSTAPSLSSMSDKRPIYLAIAMGVFCQLSGINAVLYFLNDIFAGVGLNSVSGSLRGVAIGFTNLAFTMAAMLFIDRFGRRFLLLAGSASMAFALVSIAYLFQSGSKPGWLLWLLILYCASFSFSEGAVMWVYISELFPISLREQGQSLGSTSHWIANAAISGVFPIAASASKSMPFYFFAAMMTIQFVIVHRFFPETKSRSLESDPCYVSDG